MNNVKWALSFFILMTLFHIGKSQNIQLGTWRSHFSYQNTYLIALADDKVYATSKNGLFYVDTDGSLKTLTKSDGLYGNNYSYLSYQNNLKILIIAYNDGQIDLIQNNQISSISNFRLSNVDGSKKINSISLNGNFAYLSTPQGLVVLDLLKKEIREAYRNIGINGGLLEVYCSEIWSDTLWVSTSQGIRKAAVNKNLNLQDFQNWKSVQTGLPSSKKVKYLSKSSQSLMAALDSAGIYVYSNQTTKWTKNNFTQIASTTIIQDLNYSNQKLSITLDNKVLLQNDDGTLTEINNSVITKARQAKIDTKGKIWFVDAQNGLYNLLNNQAIRYTPNGPARNEIDRLTFLNNKILALSGGFGSNNNPLNNNGGFFEYENGQWTNYNAFDKLYSKLTPDVKDMHSAVFNVSDKKTYIASLSNGILIRNQDNTFQIIDQNTLASPLRTQSNGSVQITDVGFNSKGDLYVLNPNTTSQNVHVRKISGSWQSFSATSSESLYPQQLLIDQNSIKWIRLLPSAGGGIWLLDDERNRSRILNTNISNGAFPSALVSTMVMDLDGQIWLGTDKGIAVITNPNQAFSSNLKAFTPIYENRPLLRSDNVLSLAVDGANRKWIGTNRGLWLFNVSGTELIKNFTTSNSPLPSDTILSLAIEQKSGEVFIGTTQGIVSYRSDASDPAVNNSGVSVFPNPVRPNYNGVVGITGVPNNCFIKITDVSGRVVYETQANGATASWAVRDFNGNRVPTGIYLIIGNDAQGGQTFIEKIAVID